MNARERADLIQAFSRVPLYFEPVPVKGNEAPAFLAQGSGYEAKLEAARAELTVAKPPTTTDHTSSRAPSASSLTMSLAHSNPDARPIGAGELEGKVNYLIGDDPQKWATGITTYERVRIPSVYPGVDMIYYGNQTQLQFDFVVAPGADANRIRLDFDGATRMTKGDDGQLVLSLPNGDVVLRKPFLYQLDDTGQKRPVDGEFAMVGRDSVKFHIGDYDQDRPLVIDPILTYSTFLPGASIGYDIDVDDDGNAVVTGNSFGGVPTTTGANRGGVFVTKFNPQGSSLVFSTRVGGSSGSEGGRAVRLDSSGNIVVAGSTSSIDFPSVNAVKRKSSFFASSNGGDTWSNANSLTEPQTYQIAASFQDANLLYAATGGRIYKSTDSGTTWANVTNNLPPNSSFQLISVNPANSAELLTATSLGLYRTTDGGASWSAAAGATAGSGISAIEYAPSNPQIIYLANGSAVRKTTDGGTTWKTLNTGLPTSGSLATLAVDPQDPSTVYVGSSQQGIYKSVDGGLNWSAINTGISGDNSNIIRKLVVDPNNRSTLYAATGNYASANLIFKSTNAGANWSLVYTSTGSGGQEIGAFAVGRTNSSRLYVGRLGDGIYRSDDAGATWSRAQSGLTYNRVTTIVESPVVPGKLFAGAGVESNINDAFVFKLNPAGNTFIFSTTLGGSDYEYGYALAVDPDGNTYVGGTTKSLNFPTVNAAQTRQGSEGTTFISEDGFVTKIASGGGTIGYSTYLGGNSVDYVNALAVDGQDRLLITGKTQSPNFPLAGALQPTLRGIDAFLTKLSPDGATIQFSTFWGTTGEDSGNSVSIDPNSNDVIVVGQAGAAGLPTVGAFQPDFKGGTDGFITKFSARGNQAVFSTYFGGADNDRVQDVALDAQGNIYVAGTSNSKDFPQLRSVKSRSPYFRSSDRAASWSNFNTNIFSDVYDFAFHPMDPAVILAATDFGLFRSTDGGDTWGKISSVPTAGLYSAVEYDPTNANRIYLAYRELGGSARLAVSNDAGTSWVGFSQFPGGSDPVFKIVVASTDPQVIYAGNFFSIYKSTDAGATWQRMVPFSIWPVQDFAVNPSEPSTLFFAQAYSNGGVHRSTDGGATWQKMSNGISGEYGEFVTIDPQQPSTVYARTAGGIFKSIDDGGTWTNVVIPSPGRRIIVDPFSSSTLYLTGSLSGTNTNYGMYRSQDGGLTWTIYNAGLPVKSYFRTVEADPRLTGVLHGTVGLDSSINDDVFVAKLNPEGSGLIYSSVIGGDIHTGNAFQDVAFGLGVTPSGSAFVTGGTTSPDFPTTPGAYYRTQNNTTLFVTRFDPSWTVKGRITDQQTGSAVEGVTVDLDGSSTATDGLGKYMFPNVAENASFELVPRKLGYDFTPPSYSISSLGRDEVLDFTGVYVTYTLSGRVTYQGGPLANVTVDLSGSQSGTTTTDAGGNFSFTVPKYGDYSVRPTYGGYIFTPQTATFAKVTGDQRADFAAREGYAIGGQILRDGSPVAGVAVNLTGSAAQTTSTDNEGRYSFDAGRGGDYLVTPTAEKLGFLPTNRSVAGLSSNQSADFTAFRLPSFIDYITFVSENSFTDSQTEIFNVDDEGSSIRKVTNTPQSEMQPAWSPNGRRIAYINSSQLCVMDYDGRNSSVIVASMPASSPDWSPDGSKITFSGYDGSGSNIYIVNADGTGLKRITDLASGNYNPNWSPDGTRIAFSRIGKIYTMNPDGSNATPVIAAVSTISEDDPDWSPDSRQIVFAGSNGSEPRLYVVGLDGTNLRRLTSEEARESGPAWSLDGTRIAYLREGSFGNVYVVNADGSGQKQITNTTLRKYAPVWKPHTDAGAVQDFDGDSKTDVSVFRPNEQAEWWISRSTDSTVLAAQFGSSGDTPVPADYTGDGKADMAFFRSSSGTWYVLRSEDFSFYGFPFGSSSDIPAPADYDGDGKADAAVFRSSAAAWYILRSRDGGVTSTQFGAAGDRPVAADYDGDGRADLGVFRPQGASGGGEWWILRSTAGVFAASFGLSTDKAVPGDWTGDGKADAAFFRPSSGQWFVLRSEDQSYFGFPFGIEADIPVPGDYDGDGKFDAAVFRPTSAAWFLNRSTAGTIALTFGAQGDVPIPSVYVR
jgi:Tol biopolymer transport system component/photosystem II stability/assembly factor-like uncharacterized protein